MRSRGLSIAGRALGDSCPAYIVAEIGINHNGSLEMAKSLVNVAANAGCDAVKFQKRTPELCVPEAERELLRETPWGQMTYMEYRKRIEFSVDQYMELDTYCSERCITWFASCWDQESVKVIQELGTCAFKVPSALLTDRALLRCLALAGKPIILSTGMSTMEEIRSAVALVGEENLLLVHSTSTYPCPVEELNLKMIQTLKKEFHVPVGYSGHEVGLPTSVAAVALGACYVERHVTLDRAMWGSDQAASIEPLGLERLVRHIRSVEAALGDGVKRVYDSEYPAMYRLRRVSS